MASASDAITYAEKNLSVHQVYEDALTARAELDSVLTELGDKRDLLRDLEFRLHDAEMAVVSDERGKHPEMSQTAMEKHIKVAFSNDASVRGYREQISALRGDIEGLEFDRQMAETDIKIRVARMTELAGYLQYLAIIKDVANRGSVHAT